MSGRVGSITTDIIADGLVFNMDPANRASTIPSTSTTEVFNTLDMSVSGSINGATFNSEGYFNFDGIDDYILYEVVIAAIAIFSQQDDCLWIWGKINKFKILFSRLFLFLYPLALFPFLIALF